MPIDITCPEPGISLVSIANESRRNALGPAEFEGLAQAWRQLEGDPSVRCVVVTGRGTQAFCSGAQLDADFSAVGDIDAMVDAALLKTHVMRKPMVAAVNGHCVAGGFELMMACDVRVTSEAARLGLPEVHWGIMPSGGAAMKLIEQIGHARAMQLLLTAELVVAQRALEFGLVNAVVAPDKVMRSPSPLRAGSPPTARWP
jgi:enoyl-CoA hydratase